jgi:hypothetical protein
MRTTSSAVSAGRWPERLALLDTTGPPMKSSSLWHRVSRGTRSATVPPAPRTR